MPKSRLPRANTAVGCRSVKDWLWGVTTKQPVVDNNSGKGANAFEAESLLSVYHLVTWSKANGGAGITPGHGKWENVKSVFPIHNGPANRALLKQLSQKFFLNKKDFDQIRDLFGSKVVLATHSPVLPPHTYPEPPSSGRLLLRLYAELHSFHDFSCRHGYLRLGVSTQVSHILLTL